MQLANVAAKIRREIASFISAPPAWMCLSSVVLLSGADYGAATWATAGASRSLAGFGAFLGAHLLGLFHCGATQTLREFALLHGAVLQ